MKEYIYRLIESTYPGFKKDEKYIYISTNINKDIFYFNNDKFIKIGERYNKI